jgi:hypothetical protein
MPKSSAAECTGETAEVMGMGSRKKVGFALARESGETGMGLPRRRYPAMRLDLLRDSSFRRNSGEDTTRGAALLPYLLL